jgi:hypothetical protein
MQGYVELLMITAETNGPAAVVVVVFLEPVPG